MLQFNLRQENIVEVDYKLRNGIVATLSFENGELTDILEMRNEGNAKHKKENEQILNAIDSIKSYDDVERLTNCLTEKVTQDLIEERVKNLVKDPKQTVRDVFMEIMKKSDEYIKNENEKNYDFLTYGRIPRINKCNLDTSTPEEIMDKTYNERIKNLEKKVEEMCEKSLTKKRKDAIKLTPNEEHIPTENENK